MGYLFEGVVMGADTSNSRVVRWMDRRFYSGYEYNWDDALFRVEIMKYLRKEGTILDVGAGAGIVPQMNFRGLVKRVCGVDPDPRVVANAHLDEGRVALAESIPFADASFDLAFSDNVLEHLSDPAAGFREIARVLKPGGVFLAKTPNKWHYMPLIARLTPHRFHQYINKKRGRESIDTFPTLYRANTSREIAEYAHEAGIHVCAILLKEGRPEYLRLNPLTYLFGWIYEYIVNHIPGLSRFRILLIAILRKPIR